MVGFSFSFRVLLRWQRVELDWVLLGVDFGGILRFWVFVPLWWMFGLIGAALSGYDVGAWALWEYVGQHNTPPTSTSPRLCRLHAPPALEMTYLLYSTGQAELDTAHFTRLHWDVDTDILCYIIDELLYIGSISRLNSTSNWSHHNHPDNLT
jgi:hypothetical protein